MSTLLACGGGSGSTTVTAQSFAGTVASGAPMIGTVTVKDSTGKTKTVTIESNKVKTIMVNLPEDLVEEQN